MKTADARTFRATTEAWLGQLLLPFCFFVLLTITAVNAVGFSPTLGALGLVILAMVAVLDGLLPMARNWLSLDINAIQGSLNGHYFHVYWTEVLAAWLYEHRRRRFLCLGTREGTLVIPLRFFDNHAIWQTARAAAPPDALAEDAFHRLPDYQDWEKARGQILRDPSPRQVTDHWLVQVVGWSGVAIFLYGIVQAMRTQEFGQALICLGLIGVCLALLFNWGVTEIGPEKIRRTTVFNRFFIEWDAVRWIEIDLFESVVVFGGEDRQLVIPGPGVWNGPGRREAMGLLLAQANQRSIPIRRTLLAFVKVSRNAKVTRDREDQS